MGAGGSPKSGCQDQESPCTAALAEKENPLGSGGSRKRSTRSENSRKLEATRQSETTQEPTTTKQADKNRILIIDDNKDLATSLARLLRLLGYEVEVVFDGWQGIELARTFQPRVVLLDIGLPNFDGYQVARVLRQEGFVDTVIIAVSGYGLEEDQRRAREAGMNYHVTKPVDVRTIADLIGAPGGSPAPSP
jgi:CheY-like chemotaxis protein